VAARIFLPDLPQAPFVARAVRLLSGLTSAYALSAAYPAGKVGCG
jgi:hypothetical protein